MPEEKRRGTGYNDKSVTNAVVEFLFGAMSDFFAPEKFPLETGLLLVKGFFRRLSLEPL